MVGPRFYFVRELASGGMGRVDLVLRREGTFRRFYAIKQPHPRFRDDESFHRMFMDEARLAGAVRHPNVVSVLDVGENEEGPFLVMDYVDGASLSTIIARGRHEQIPLDAVLSWAHQVLDGLHAAHELKDESGQALHLVHRDVSPQNILVGFDGRARVTDFGIAKALGRSSKTATGLLKGKTGYISPEQLRFEDIDRRADLFSFGVVLFEMLAGRRLYANHDGRAPRRILTEDPPDIGSYRTDLPPALVELVFEVLAKDPEDRPATAEVVSTRLVAIRQELRSLGEPAVDLAEYLAELLDEEHTQSRLSLSDAVSSLEENKLPPWPPTQAAPPAPPRRWPLVAVIGALALAVGIGVGRLDSADSSSSPNMEVAVGNPPAVAAAEPEPETMEAAEAAPAEVDAGITETVTQAPRARSRRRARRAQMRPRARVDPPEPAAPMQVDMGMSISPWSFHGNEAAP